MFGFDFVNEELVQRLNAGVATMKNARMFIRRVGPIVTVNVVITNIELGSGDTGDLHTNVHLGAGERVQDVQEIAEPVRERQITLSRTVPKESDLAKANAARAVTAKKAAAKKSATPKAVTKATSSRAASTKKSKAKG